MAALAVPMPHAPGTNNRAMAPPGPGPAAERSARRQWGGAQDAATGQQSARLRFGLALRACALALLCPLSAGLAQTPKGHFWKLLKFLA